ncbi:MAG: thioredoxin [Verrucomicrobiaceae bacterium]|nr:MAG: thioredoxin [Verrucomicrobiaceae bacterium]
MTNEQRAKIIKRVFFLVLTLAVVAGVWFYPKEKIEEVVLPPSPENGLLIVHYHQPGNKPSEQLAGILTKVQAKYGKLVIVQRLDFTKNPTTAKTHGVTKPPHVVMISREKKVFDFQGLWTQQQVEQKVEEILRGLKRMTKDWRPPVPGMKPAGTP